MIHIPVYCLGFAFDIPEPKSEGNIFEVNVALIRKIKPAWQAGSLNGIGGMIEDFDHGDGASRAGLNAMVREFQEETGFETSHADWKHFHTMGSDTWQVECFRTFNVSMGELATTTDEEVVIVRADCLPVNVLFNLRWLIPLALDPQTLPTMQVYR